MFSLLRFSSCFEHSRLTSMQKHMYAYVISWWLLELDGINYSFELFLNGSVVPVERYV